MKPPSVTNIIKKLNERKFVNHDLYRDIVLTQKGKLFAEALVRRHQMLKRFLILIGVSEDYAERDSCSIEHKIGSESMDKLIKFVEFVESAPQNPLLIEHLKYYSKTGKRPKQCSTKKLCQ